MLQTRFLLAGAINKVCFILAAFVPGVLTAVNARKFSTIFCLHRQIISIDKII
jgi:hypothetical protein